MTDPRSAAPRLGSLDGYPPFAPEGKLRPPRFPYPHQGQAGLDWRWSLPSLQELFRSGVEDFKVLDIRVRVRFETELTRGTALELSQ